MTIPGMQWAEDVGYYLHRIVVFTWLIFIIPLFFIPFGITTISEKTFLISITLSFISTIIIFKIIDWILYIPETTNSAPCIYCRKNIPINSKQCPRCKKKLNEKMDEESNSNYTSLERLNGGEEKE